MKSLKLILLLLLIANSALFSQNVGVGTLNPLQKLHVNGDIRIDGDSLIFNNTSPTSNTSMFFNHGSGQNWIFGYDHNHGPIGGMVISRPLSNTLIINNNGRVGIGTAQPAARLQVADSSVVFTGPTSLPVSPAIPPIQGAGTRMMWYPEKAAFRVGTVVNNTWDRDSIGNYSIAGGLNTKAKGNYSVAFGVESEASGHYATVFGSLTQARGNASLATGNENVSNGNSSTTMGYGNTSNGKYSTVMGERNIGNGYGSLVVGRLNEPIVSSQNSIDATTPLFIIGNGIGDANRKNAMVARNDGRIGIGTNIPTARLHVADSSVVFTGPTTLPASLGPPPIQGAGIRMMWYPEKAAFRVGRVTNNIWNRDSIGNYSFASGYNTKAKGSYSTAMGRDTEANGYISTAMGYSTDAIGDASTAMGYSTDATGDYSTAMGRYTKANGYACTTIGNYNEPIVTPQTAVTPTTPLFIIGNGTNDGNRKNVMVARNDGRIGIGTNIPAARLHVADSSVVFTGPVAEYYSQAPPPPIQGEGTRMMWYREKAAFRVGEVLGNNWDRDSIGFFSIAVGLSTKAKGDASTAMGEYTEAIGDASTAMGYKTGAYGNHSTAMGYFTGAYGNHSTAMGEATDANGYACTAIGVYNDPIVTPQAGVAPTTPLFIIGNGDYFQSSNAMVVRKDGRVGLSTDAPTNQLHIGGGESGWDKGIRLDNSSTANDYGVMLFDGDMKFRTFKVGSDFVFRNSANTSTATLYSTGNMTIAGTLTELSDRRLKKDITPIKDAMNKLTHLKAYHYYWNAEDKDPAMQTGLMAQEVETYMPELVKTNQDGYKSVNYIGLIPYMIDAINQINKEKSEIKKDRTEELLAIIMKQQEDINLLKEKIKKMEEEDK